MGIRDLRVIVGSGEPRPDRRQHRRGPAAGGLRILEASSQVLSVGDRTTTRKQMKLRQGWQSQAWDLRDIVPELRYAVNFKSNCSARMRLYVGAYDANAGEDDVPKRLDQLQGVPPEITEAAQTAIKNLGNGRLALSGLMGSLSSNWDVAGEAWLLGRVDPLTRQDVWSIRSVDEIRIQEGEWRLHEYPGDNIGGEFGFEVLDPESTYLSRMWNPHPRWQKLADSPTKAILDTLESLQLMRRDIRAKARSRLAGAGMLLIPDNIDIKVPGDDNQDPQADSFMDELTLAMMLPIDDEGTAAAVVPIVVRGAPDALAQVRHLDLSGQLDAKASETRSELVGVIATGIDLPKEVVEGVVDLNHWSAWQVDDNTFRHHLEPHEIQLVDALTGAHLRPFLEDYGCDPDWIGRLLYWYDPIELVTKPDRTSTATQAYGDQAISAKAYRREIGFTEDDAPSVTELEARRVQDIRTLPLNLLMELARRWDPSLVVPPITGPGIVPGIKAGAVDMPPEIAAAIGAPAAPATGGPGAPPPAPADEKGPPEADGPPDPQAPGEGLTAAGWPEDVVMAKIAYDEVHRRAATGDRDALVAVGQLLALERDRATEENVLPAITAAASAPPPANVRLSRQLAMIDQDLRARLQTAANDAMIRRLESAGARLRTQVNGRLKNETMKASIAHTRNERVGAVLGRSVLTATGLTEDDLMGDWSQFKGQFLDWVAAAQTRSLDLARRLTSLPDDSPALEAARGEFEQNRESAWASLQSALTALGHHLLWNPAPNATSDWADKNPATLVPSGMLRSALAVAGGDIHATTTIDHTTGVVSTSLSNAGQIGTGQTITNLVTSAGGQRQGYQWVHGPALQEFEPHADLDGVQFVSFTDDQLANHGDWPAGEYFHPGDHIGCTCDFMPLWAA